MTSIRQIYENIPKTIITPIFLKNRRVEVIMLPLDESADKIKKPKSRRKHPIEEIIGAWEESLLYARIREPLKNVTGITANPKILGGKPIIRGTRISVKFILELLDSAISESEILEEYPHLTKEDISSCLRYTT